MKFLAIFIAVVLSSTVSAEKLQPLILSSIASAETNQTKLEKAIHGILGPDSKMKPIDATKASKEMCMLETVTKHNMIHFSQVPKETHEDVVYYLNPAEFIKAGMDISKLPKHPKELGKMKPLQWYYYDGTYVEPHQGSQLNKEFVIMSVDVK